MMSTNAPTPFAVIGRHARSRGVKLFVISFLALVMSISGVFVDNLNDERARNHGAAAAAFEYQGAVQPATVIGIRMVDSYRSMRRSLHYIPLFLGLVFLTYFLFEVTTGKSVHPAQYVMVGVAQVIFYLLLLSLAEHIGFDWSFLIAGAATISLFSINTEWIFKSRALAMRALTIFTLLYGFIYVLLRVEAYALLIGAIAAFIAIALAMYMTRDVDWYGSGSNEESAAE
ncbi:cell envelope integrity protein CreD [Terriglobus tenax]|uniref:cell envelope integrity protein CreD n=1 Tax=Terriglobus tenax TaxID=1111115 RepID=UPI0021E0A97C|nr:cell envelope integrity protein CreD [Terriglobus tenax]